MKTINGMKIRDARSSIRVEIKLDDVKKNGVKQPSRCAAAKALCRAPGISEARVHISKTYVRPKGEKHWVRYDTPAQLRTEIIAFDRGGRFHPGEFELRKPRATHGWQQGSSRNQTRRGPKETRTYVIAEV